MDAPVKGDQLVFYLRGPEVDLDKVVDQVLIDADKLSREDSSGV